MQFTTLLTTAAVLIASVLGQTPSGTATGSAASAAPTGLVGLVDALPHCALGCLEDAATAINCTTSDLPCICGKSQELVTAITPCLFTQSPCSSEEKNGASSPPPSILVTSSQGTTDASIPPALSMNALKLCNDVKSASPADIAAASSAVNSAVSNAPVSAGATSTASGNLAARTDSPVVGMGYLGAAAALAALAF